ncbi:ABC transporter ATP-binding protein [Hydrogenoanaerobacterium sp.]|uniref:ABC transporter ATP-binding protein n=1 Tax=Hydrogenoanaerobacterium sp. TaxID=2953763 RepID=UPI0028A181F5|nr:ABC transporter ATP-binding protein [Hydrogenoanaerobacterium sp.]
MENILEVRNLNKKYHDFELQNVSFSLPKGSIMGFIGENGAGKTTTLKLILNEIKRSSGEIVVFGLDNIHNEKHIKQDIGVVFDENFFYYMLKPVEIGKILKATFSNWDDALYEQYLNRFKLPKNKPMKEFSRGMKMKLSIAAALSHHPRLLLLDEATSGLDPVVRGEILDVFLDFIQDEEHSILLSSHITSDLEKIADYITFIHDGKVVLSAGKDEILDSYGVVRGSEAELAAIDKQYLVGTRSNRFGCDALVNNRVIVAQQHPALVMDNAKLDDIMMYYVEGEVE